LFASLYILPVDICIPLLEYLLLPVPPYLVKNNLQLFDIDCTAFVEIPVCINKKKNNMIKNRDRIVWKRHLPNEGRIFL
jgi:hypothetical protein